MSTKVLLVEDEEAIRKFVLINLEKAGFLVKEAASGEEGISIIKSDDVDMMVLDIMLPGIDGFEVARIIRKDYPHLGILMLTAKAQDVDKILGLECGTDDYMVKPFNPKELVLRLKSLERRLGKVKHFEETVPFEIDCENRMFYKNGKEITLTPTEFAIIGMFMESRSQTLSREEILEKVWGYHFGDTKIVDVNIRRLRAKIEEDPANPEHLETIWGVGYRFNL